MRGIKIIGRIFSILLTVLLAFLLLLNVTTLVRKGISGNPRPTVFGFYSAVVVSGSMEPEISVNDMVISQNQKDYGPGDVITYESGSSLVTHRIIEAAEGGFTTKGDANNTPDMDTVFKEQIIGKVVWKIPQIGLVIKYLQTPLGMLCLVLIGVLLIAVPGWLERKKAEKINSGGNEDEHS